MSIVDRVKNILLNPKTEWEVIKGESTTVADLIKNYAMILAAIPAIAGFIGYSLFGMNLGFRTLSIPVSYSIGWMILTYVFAIVGVFVVGYVIDFLAPTFGSQKDLVSSMKVAVYSYTASWVAGILSLFPILGVLGFLLGLYSLYLLYLGLKTVKEVPQDKMVVYFIAIIVAVIILSLIIGSIVSALTIGSLMTAAF